MIRLAAATAAAALIASGAFAAQMNAPAPPAKPAPAAKTAMASKTTTTVTHTAASIDCSKQADAKGLHGKARKEFRSSCKAAAKGK